MKRREFVKVTTGTMASGAYWLSGCESGTSPGRSKGGSLWTFLRNLEAGTIATVAGVGWKEGGEAATTAIGWPLGVVRNKHGELIVAEFHGHRLWRIDQNGILRTFAGDGVSGFAGDGGSAREARVDMPHDLWRDAAGNLYFSDLGNHRIRRIDAETEVITTVAGCGISGHEGDGGPATEAQLEASGVATDSAGNLYIAQYAHHTVRVVDRKGIIRRFAGIGIGRYNGDGIPAREAALHYPEHLFLDSEENLYICDNSNDRIRKVEKNGIIRTVLGNPVKKVVDGQFTRSSSGDGGPATEASILMPDSIFIDRHDNLYVGEKYGFRVRKVDARTGVVSTVVGTGVPGFGEDGDVGERTQINSTEAGLWVDPDGSVLWTDCSRRLRRLDAGTRIVTTLLGGTSVGDGELARKACLAGPSGLSVSPNGTIYFADTLNLRIRAIDPETWQIRTVAGNGARAYGGDGAPATEAYLGYPYGVALDREGNLYVADTRHSRVRRVDRQGIISAYVGNGLPWDSGDGGPAISASVTHPHSVVIGPEGHLYLGDAPGRIRRVDRSNGMITTVVGTGIQGYRGDGGPARQARISSPSALAFDAEGNLYFADTDNHCVRKVDRNGTIHTVVGTGEPGASDEGIRATKFRLKAPRGVAVDAFGILYVSDTGNSRVVAVAPDRRVVTLAGTGEAGDSGDGGPARQCQLNHPYNIVVVEGCLLVSDHLNNRIRAVKLAPLT